MSVANCLICLKPIKKLIKCSGNNNTCKWISCKSCIIKWFNTSKQFACPVCKELKTFELDYSQFPDFEAEEYYTEDEDVPWDDPPSLISIMSFNPNNEHVSMVQDDTLEVIQNILNIISTNNFSTNLPTTKHTTVHSALNGLTEDIINDILQEGRVFPSDNFIANYENWPESVKNKWTYKPVTMPIDDIQEIVGYEIIKCKV